VPENFKYLGIFGTFNKKKILFYVLALAYFVSYHLPLEPLFGFYHHTTVSTYCYCCNFLVSHQLGNRAYQK